MHPILLFILPVFILPAVACGNTASSNDPAPSEKAVESVSMVLPSGSQSSGTGATPATQPSASAESPLALTCKLTHDELCAWLPRGCPTADQAEQYINAQVLGRRKNPNAPGCYEATIGRCGALTTMEFSDGYSRYKVYFDSAGAVVAGKTFNDAPAFCNKQSNWGSYGEVPDCKDEVVKDLCRRPKQR